MTRTLTVLTSVLSLLVAGCGDDGNTLNERPKPPDYVQKAQAQQRGAGPAPPRTAKPAAAKPAAGKPAAAKGAKPGAAGEQVASADKPGAEGEKKGAPVKAAEPDKPEEPAVTRAPSSADMLRLGDPDEPVRLPAGTGAAVDGDSPLFSGPGVTPSGDYAKMKVHKRLVSPLVRHWGLPVAAEKGKGKRK